MLQMKATDSGGGQVFNSQVKFQVFKSQKKETRKYFDPESSRRPKIKANDKPNTNYAQAPAISP